MPKYECKCRVCTTGKWLKQKTDLTVWESWDQDTFNLEGKWNFNRTEWNEFKYNLQFNKVYIWWNYIRKYKKDRMI